MKYIFLSLIILFTACSVKDYEYTQTKVIIIKSPKIKFSDLGYLRNSSQSIELELFIAGKAIEKISVNNLICVKDGCMSKSSFNEDYLNETYPNDILQNILLAQPIYQSKNKVLSSDGFEQYIKDENVNIKYVVKKNSTFFKDVKNKIIFKIKDTNE